MSLPWRHSNSCGSALKGRWGSSLRCKWQVMSMHDVCISPDGRFRYSLEAKVSGDDGRVCMFLMLNPSTADAVKSDRTVSTCKRFARTWGYGTVRVCNLFALRSPYPSALRDGRDPVGPENDDWILRNARNSEVIVCAWGNHGSHLERSAHVRRMLDHEGLSGKLRHLGLTKVGQPRHPLRIRADTVPMPFPN